MKKSQFYHVSKHFQVAIAEGLLKFETEKENRWNEEKTWLTVSCQETLHGRGGEWKWKHIQSLVIEDFETPEALTNQITMMLAETIRSTAQDINILFDDYEMTRKSSPY